MVFGASTGIRTRVEGMRVLHDGPLHYTSVDVLATDLSYLAISQQAHAAVAKCVSHSLQFHL